MAGMASPPGKVSRRAMASVSMMAAPCDARSTATVLLPLPMPPVRPIRSTRLATRTPEERGSGPAKPIEYANRPGEHHHHAGAREERTEGHIAAFTQSAADFQANADDRADDRGGQHDRQNHLDPQPCAERGQ